MMNAQSTQGECIDLCRMLLQCLKDERNYLIALDGEGLQENNRKKEKILGLLKDKKKELNECLKNLSDFEQKDSEWQKNQKEWACLFGDLQRMGESNQFFMRRSLNNIQTYLGHFKALLGDWSLYSPDGKKIDVKNRAQVLEVRL